MAALSTPGAFGVKPGGVAPFHRVPLSLFRGNRDRLTALFQV